MIPVWVKLVAALVVLLLLAAAGLWLKVALERGPERIVTRIVERPGLEREVVKWLERPPTIIERIKTVELRPDSVSVSTTALDSSAQASLRYGIVAGEKDGRRLSLSIFDRSTGRLERHDLSLPRRDSDFTLRSGSRPLAMRADRDLGFQLGGDVSAAVRVLSPDGLGPDLLRVDARGPLVLRRHNLAFAPWAFAEVEPRAEEGADVDWGVGVQARVSLW